MFSCNLALAIASFVAAVEQPLVPLQPGAIPTEARPHFVTVTPARHEGSPALKLHFQVSDWPHLLFAAPEGLSWDWRGHAGVAVELFNPEAKPVDVAMRVDNAGADGVNHCNTVQGVAPPGETYTLALRFNLGDAAAFWGMRGVPERGPLGTGAVLDLEKITAFQVFLNCPQEEHTLLFLRAYLFGEGGPLDTLVPFPFIDRFGQYKHRDWPGKLHEEAELAARRDEEAAQIAAKPTLDGRDKFGGWADGPQREATGWFRTEQVDGKWWLVTPEGRLFFSIGMDCVGTWERTFVEEREPWFEWLPAADDPQFGEVYGHASGVHSMAETIDGTGRTFSFYTANLIRKYGENWPEAWRTRSLERLQAWGFNTLGSWCQGDVINSRKLPYVAIASSGEVQAIAAATGYWAKMKDVYDPGFEAAVDKAIAATVAPHAAQPLCIGYFVDNELAWEGIQAGTLNSPETQPCRQAFIQALQEKYGSMEALNTAWESTATDWAGLRYPQHLTQAAKDDLNEYLYRFAHRYFTVVQDAIRRHAPHQLYLGCRFSTAPDAAVQACVDAVDVVSYNLYYREIPCEKFEKITQGKKPIIIGEFHFGALDRGMFHTGLVPTRDQNERAQQYRHYLETVLACPAFIGCHWFQYVDEPNTGRTWDGENYNIGFVDVTDTPYPELSAAAKAIHEESYSFRAYAPATE
ncbi:MAG: beta-galactosidase [Candidatus Hydrogenedentes bacterium]|nr:beta-galactosidase [Candidatus Hydrogenedentota bacterium]